ncbi:MAG: 5'-nucleotidase [Candidatus Rifleibacterium amylolyticum]|nr:MAG: 5'-nucleotidase [Candidatus Rifleibacterium amylolyticum]
MLSSPTAAEVLHFTVLHTSDEHSSLMPVPLVDYRPGEHDRATGGFARLATLISRIRSQKPDIPALLLSSGDFIGGTPFSWLILNDSSPELEIMHHLGYNATTIGNHEFDYGSHGLANYFIRLQTQGKLLPVIVSNLRAPPDHPINQAGIKENHILELANGLKTGIFALLGRGAHRVSPDAKPLDFVEQHQCAREQVAKLKKAGANVIIALTHAGIAEDRELAGSVAGIDLILGGHEHLQLPAPEKAGNTLIMHSGYYTQNLGQLDLAWDTDSQKLDLLNRQTGAPFLHKIDSNIPEDPQTAAIIEDYRRQLNDFVASFTAGEFADISQIVARSEFALPRNLPFNESTIGNFVTDAMRIETEKLLGERVDFALQANGTIRGGLLVGSDRHNAGKITLFDLISISSMGNGPDKLPGYPLVSLYLTGAEIHRLLEIAVILPQLWGDIYFLQFSGLRYTYDPARTFWMRQVPLLKLPWPSGKSVISAERLVKLGETADQDVYEPFPDDGSKLYHLVTTHYLANYLPMVGTRLPKLKLTVKNKHGKEVNLDDSIIRENTREFKVWEATARYIASFDQSADNLPTIPTRYQKIEGRINTGQGEWLWFWPLLTAIIILVVLLMLAISLIRRRKKSGHPVGQPDLSN